MSRADGSDADGLGVADVKRGRFEGALARARAGLLAGLAVGLGDTLWTAVRGVGGLTAGKTVSLVTLGASWWGVAAAASALAVGALLSAFARVLPGRTRARKLALATTALAAPALTFVALAMFSGRRAATIPGRRALSVALAVVGVAAVYGLARGYASLFEPTASRKVWRRAWLGGLGAVAVASEMANVLVLPRLYPWFHAALAVVTGASAVLFAGLLQRRTSEQLVSAADSPRSGERVRVRGRFQRVALVAGFVVVGWAALHESWVAPRSQIVRFAALERTGATAQLLRLSPVSLHARPLMARVRHDAEADLPALPEGPRRPDASVVFITIDALRADHLGAFGYRRHPTTPHIDALAARSVRFRRAYAQAPHTSFSVSSMLTGKYFPTFARLATPDVHDPLPWPLRQYGWRTASFYPPAVFFVDAHKLKAYADTNFQFEYVKFEYMEAQKRVDQVIHYYEDVKPRRSFVWVHFFEPHEPYVAHPEFPFGSGDVDRYDSEIAYTDAAVGRLLDYVAAHVPQAIVILAADHGEEFDEHGGRYHGSTLFEEQVHVPLLISVPGVEARDVNRPVELIDLAPTILNLLDIPAPARMRGVDLGPWLASPPAPADRLPPAFAEVDDKRMVARGDEKLICDLSFGFCSYYDLRADPDERQNRADDAPERVASLRAQLDDWLDSHARFEPRLSAGAANPDGQSVPRAIERGRVGDVTAGPDLARLMTSAESLPVRREAAELLASLPPQRETAPALAAAVNDADPIVGDWAVVGAARAGDASVSERAHALVTDPRRPRKLRVQGAMALASNKDAAGVPTLAEALGDCQTEVLLCRNIVIQLGKLRDRRAVPALLTYRNEVQNRREVIEALGDIGDPAAIPALLEHLTSDAYVPVRAQAARSLGKLGQRQAIPALERAAHEDTEASVASAARDAIAALKAKRPG